MTRVRRSEAKSQPDARQRMRSVGLPYRCLRAGRTRRPRLRVDPRAAPQLTWKTVAAVTGNYRSRKSPIAAMTSRRHRGSVPSIESLKASGLVTRPVRSPAGGGTPSKSPSISGS